MSQRLMVAASVLLLSICSARAQAPSAEAMTAARSVVTTMKLADPYAGLLPGVVLGLRPSLVQDRPELEREFDALMPEVRQWFGPYRTAISDALATAYATSFSVRELREIEAFYKQPV